MIELKLGELFLLLVVFCAIIYMYFYYKHSYLKKENDELWDALYASEMLKLLDVIGNNSQVELARKEIENGTKRTEE